MKTKIIKLYLLFSFITLCVNAQTNTQQFENELCSKLKSSVIFKGYDFEGFAICIKVGSKGQIDDVLFSLSAIPELKEKLNTLKKDIDYKNLLQEVKIKKWKSVNIIIPVLINFESVSQHKTFNDIDEYARNRLIYFSTFNVISDDYITNCIILKPLVFTSTEPVR